MYRHIVLFKFRDDVNIELREKAYLSFKKGIENLPTVIPTIREIEVGRNTNDDEQWDICLNGLFETLDDIKAYGANEAHQKVAGRLKPLLAARSCVDYVTSLHP